MSSLEFRISRHQAIAKAILTHIKSLETEKCSDASYEENGVLCITLAFLRGQYKEMQSDLQFMRRKV